MKACDCEVGARGKDKTKYEAVDILRRAEVPGRRRSCWIDLMGCALDHSPREHGVGTVDTFKAMLAGDVKVFVSMGSSSSRSPPR